MKAATVILAVSLTFISLPSTAGWPDIDIDLVTCQPDGVIASMSEGWDPLKFWAHQHVELEFALEDWSLKDDLDYCRIDYSYDKTGLLECNQYYSNRHRSVVKCLSHARKLCRHHGGRC